MRVDIHNRIAEIDRDDWNALNVEACPFLRHEFLAAAEQTACVAEATGWQPAHIAIRDDDGRLAAAMPLYRKSHSWGEFVFDWAWARAYEQAGLDYYPKLVSAVPFTPAASRRLLADAARREELSALLLEQALLLAGDGEHSSLHVQFPHPDELPLLTNAGLKLRKDCQFHWHNRGYRTFDDFLRQFSSRKRKKVRRDRRHVTEQGVRFRRLHGADMDAALWHDVYQLISITFLRRGSMPYFSRDFFMELGERLPGQLLVVLAELRRQPIAAAVFYVGPGTLYGRYWGADAHYNALHFETCYYQGIDYCIDRGLQTFEPGTQGEHKISRGFLPVTTWSAHWLAHDEFFAAVGHYLYEEQRHIDRYIDAVDELSPYRKTAVPRPANRE
jgi:hypothetical protein